MILLLSVFAALLVTSVILAVIIGPVWIPPRPVWEVALAQLLGSPRGGWTKAQEHIVVFIRFPRVLLSSFVGSDLPAVGVVVQAAITAFSGTPFFLFLMVRKASRSRGD